MKVIINAIIIALVGAIALYAVIRIPTINQQKNCYKQLMEVYNQNGIITRQSHMSGEQICTDNKAMILKGIECFRTANTIDDLYNKEASYLDTIARFSARAIKTTQEAVEQHNNTCTSRKTRILFDLTRQDPYAANFE